MVKHEVRFGSIGSDELPGLSKMVEENGEAGQVIGKIMQVGNMRDHWDGKGLLKERLEDELADQMAAISFFAMENGLDMDRMGDRTTRKFLQFSGWHDNIQAGRDPQ